MATTVSNNTSSNSILQSLASTSSSSKSGSTSSSSKLSGGTSSADDVQKRFLDLLVTQLKNQDPLNPMDNAQMTSQLSQISTVSGIEKLNTTLEKLMTSYATSQNMQAANLIGKGVLIEGSSLELYKDGAVGGVTLAGAADKVTVTIKDANGKVVQTEELGAQPAGTVSFGWDGKDADGNAMATGKYTFSVKATNGGKAIDATALTAGMVSALTMAGDGVALQLSNGKTINYSDIKQIM